MTREKVRISSFGSREEVQRILNCEHAYVRRGALLLSYIKADFYCPKCGDWKRDVQKDKSST